MAALQIGLCMGEGGSVTVSGGRGDGGGRPEGVALDVFAGRWAVCSVVPRKGISVSLD